MRIRRAFTLVEILIVLFVIGLLVALLFPIFSRARENAQLSNYKSNLKQIGLGFAQYERDYDERFPLAYADSNSSGAYEANGDAGWAQVLQPYLKSTPVFQCPSEPLNYAPPQRATDYWYSAPVAQTQQLQLITHPARTVMCGEGVAMPAAFVATHGAIAHNGNAPALKYNGEIWDTTEKTEGQGGRRHLLGSNFLFCDDHVKWLRPETIGADKVNAGVPTFREN